MPANLLAACVVALAFLVSGGARQTPWSEYTDHFKDLRGDQIAYIGTVTKVDWDQFRQGDYHMSFYSICEVSVLKVLWGESDGVEQFNGQSTFFRMEGCWRKRTTSGRPWVFPGDTVLVVSRAGSEYTRSGIPTDFALAQSVRFLPGPDISPDTPILDQDHVDYDFSDIDWCDPQTTFASVMERVKPVRKETGYLVSDVIEAVAIRREKIGKSQISEPVFSFWRNLPNARNKLNWDHKNRHQPIPLSDLDISSCTPIRQGDPYTLIRSGALVDSGKIGRIYKGWVPRAGGDRVVFFKPFGVFETYSRLDDIFFPSLTDPVYDLYVVGDWEIETVRPDTLPIPAEVDLPTIISRLVDERTLRKNDFSSILQLDEDGNRNLPDFPEVADWIVAETSLSFFSVTENSDQQTLVLSCTTKNHRYGPYFSIFYSEKMKILAALKGELDFVLKIDKVLYFFVRAGKAGTGAWGYDVYRLDEHGIPSRIFQDGSWST